MRAEAIRGLERRLRGIVEAAMRREIVLSALREGDAEDAYALIAGVLAAPAGQASALSTLRRTVQEVLVEGGDYREVLIMAAEEGGQNGVS